MVIKQSQNQHKVEIVLSGNQPWLCIYNSFCVKNIKYIMHKFQDLNSNVLYNSAYHHVKSEGWYSTRMCKASLHLKGKIWANKSLTPSPCINCTNPGKSGVNLMYVRNIHFVCFFDFSVRLWNFSNRVALFVFPSNVKLMHLWTMIQINNKYNHCRILRKTTYVCG